MKKHFVILDDLENISKESLDWIYNTNLGLKMNAEQQFWHIPNVSCYKV